MAMGDPNPSHLAHPLSDDDADGDNEHDTSIPPDLDVAVPHEGVEYHNFEALRHAVNAWSMRDGFIARCSKKDTSRAQYRCRYFKNGCPWAVRASVHRNTGLLTITSVNADHTCSGPEIWVNHEGIEQRGKRAVHATQRWVVDTLNRIGYKPQVNTDPKDIVNIIQERYGTTITEKLAHKSRDRLLLSLGIQPPLPHGRGGRPDQVAMRKRMREAEAQMAQQRQKERLDRHSDAAGFDIDAHGEDAPEDRPFVFQSGFRVIEQQQQQQQGHQPQPQQQQRQHQHQHQMRPPSAPGPDAVPDAITQQLQQDTPEPSMTIEPPHGHTRTCPTCNGAGVLPAIARQTQNNARSHSNLTGSGSDRRSSINDLSRVSSGANASTSSRRDDEELSLLQQQVALIAKQIEVMTKRRAM